MGMYGPVEDGIRCGKGMTKQSFADECDINQILKKYQSSGVITHLSPVPAKFGDFIGMPDYRTSLDIVRKAQEAFMTLDAGVRAKFANDPAKLLDFVANGENRKEAEELGLLEVAKASGSGQVPEAGSTSGSNAGAPAGAPGSVPGKPA